MQSFKAQFLIDGKWTDNAVRFATEIEAKLYAVNIYQSWTIDPSDWRVVESSDPVNYTFQNGRTVPL